MLYKQSELCLQVILILKLHNMRLVSIDSNVKLWIDGFCQASTCRAPMGISQLENCDGRIHVRFLNSIFNYGTRLPSTCIQ